MQNAEMKRTGRSHISNEQFRSLFRRGKPVRISGIAKVLGVDRSTVTRRMRRHGTLTSVNRNAAFCVLPEMCRFDELGFCRFGEVLFFREGNQRDAICHVVANSACGMSLPEINEVMGGKMATQALGLVRSGRLRRRRYDSGYVYFAADAGIFEAQVARRREAGRAKSEATPEERLGQFLAEGSRESVELLAKVLVTCLRHPQFSAKGVALSLIRRGERTSTEQVRQWFDQFALRGKNS
jgi:hypothetical protein